MASGISNDALEPTFVFTKDGDVQLFTSVEEAARSVEAVDVMDGEYAAFFAVDGERLHPEVDGRRVRLRRTGARDVDALSHQLRAVAQRNGYEGDDPDPRVVANEVFANQWHSRSLRWPKWLDRRLHGDGPPTV